MNFLINVLFRKTTRIILKSARVIGRKCNVGPCSDSDTCTYMMEPRTARSGMSSFEMRVSALPCTCCSRTRSRAGLVFWSDSTTILNADLNLGYSWYSPVNIGMVTSSCLISDFTSSEDFLPSAYYSEKRISSHDAGVDQLQREGTVFFFLLKAGQDTRKHLL